MSQTTLDQNTTPEGAASNKPPARPRRASSRRKNPAQQAPAPAEQQAQAPAVPAGAPAEQPQPAHAAAGPHEPAEQAAAAQAEGQGQQPAEGQRPRAGHGRSRRGRGASKGGIQLVISPAQEQTAGSAGLAQAEQEKREEQTAAAQPPVAEVAAATAAERTPPAEQATPGAKPRVVPVTTSKAPTQPEQAQPAATPAPAPRRYRFDRRPGAAPAVSAPVRPERLSVSATAAPAAEARVPIAPEPQQAAPDETWQANVAEVEPSDVARSAEAGAPEAGSTAMDDLIAALGLRNGSPAPAPAPEAAAEAPTEAAAEGEAAAAAALGATVEGEGQPAGRRRRRRRRGGGASAASPAEEDEEVRAPAEPWAEAAPHVEPVEPERGLGNGYEREPYPPYAPSEQPYSPFTRAPRERAAEPQPWNSSAAQEGVRGPVTPFGAPEPSFARGFGPQPRGVAQPLRETYPRTARPERGMDTPPMSSNQLASVVSHAIQQQTDRLLSELRHQAHTPSMTVQFPAFPSTERVGVFVDVANLLYSARNLRMQIDFGRLLDFLRSNRRLIRAHAYAPTNPDPNADQSFLSAVKGLGYRITTKNYKTFASGAKKADMDLDLCMDIVRMVDAKAVDTVVLVSGDSDFLPLLEYCSDRGVRVEVAAFDDSAAMILRQSCDLFINLSVVDEIRY